MPEPHARGYLTLTDELVDIIRCSPRMGMVRQRNRVPPSRTLAESHYELMPENRRKRMPH